MIFSGYKVVNNQIEITTSFSGKISTGCYENESPMFALKQVIGIECVQDICCINIADNDIKTRAGELGELCRALFKEVEVQSKIEAIEKQRKDIRFYVINGIKYPSVTSILKHKIEFNIPQIELEQYSAQGTINHLIMAHYAKTNKFESPFDIPECDKYIKILLEGNLKLQPESGDIKALFEKYPIRIEKSEETVYNTIGYAGTADIIGYPVMNSEWEKIGAQNTLTVFDLKRTEDETMNFKQEAAYAKCCGALQICTLIVNDKTKQGFSKPNVTQNIDKYFVMFMQDFKEFKQRFGI